LKVQPFPDRMICLESIQIKRVAGKVNPNRENSDGENEQQHA
jgi:hypothetical protein